MREVGRCRFVRVWSCQAFTRAAGTPLWPLTRLPVCRTCLSACLRPCVFQQQGVMLAVPSHEHFMQMALDLAVRGSGCTSPNPLVGSVVVRDGQILGQGWHAQYGQNHAEVNAIRDAQNNHQAKDAVADAVADDAMSATRGATIYVTLEPCNHHGLTPPCTQAIIDAGISHVVYAMADPNPRAAGGADRLRDHGIRLTCGVLERQARFLNRFFLRHLESARPWVIAKSASSLDGRIATRSGHSQWITGPEARLRGHQLRQAVDAIVVGADTLIQDDPSLTVRLPESRLQASAVRHPRPVILDSRGRVPLHARLLDPLQSPRTLILTTDAMADEYRQALLERGYDVVALPANPAGPGCDPQAIVESLGERGMQGVLLEGGASVHGSFRDAGLIDEIWCFLAPSVIGGQQARSAFAGLGSDTLDEATTLDDIRIETLGKDILVRGVVRQHLSHSPCCEPSLATHLDP